MSLGFTDAKGALEFVLLIEQLRNTVAGSVELLCDNDDFNGHKNNAIIVRGEWTGWQDMRYEGDTLLACLRAASKDKRNKERA